MNLNMCNPNEGSTAIRSKGNKEFYDFVQKMYKGVYVIKSRIIRRRPMIGVFCRIDILLIIDEPTGCVDYFINEIKRMHTCSLWSNQKLGPASLKASIGTLSDMFAEVFYNWLFNISNPYAF
jgi:hypothetical protein